MGNGEPQVKVAGRAMRIHIDKLGQLYPYPRSMRFSSEDNFASAAEQRASACEAVPAARKQLYDLVRRVALKLSEADNGHVVHYAAGFLRTSGQLATFPNIASLDEMVKLHPVERLTGLYAALEECKHWSEMPHMLIISDQWGMLHAP